MRKDPVYIGPALTRDYIDRREKMRELEQRSYSTDVSISTMDLVTTWILIVGVCVWVWMVW